MKLLLNDMFIASSSISLKMYCIAGTDLSSHDSKLVALSFS